MMRMKASQLKTKLKVSLKTSHSIQLKASSNHFTRKFKENHSVNNVYVRTMITLLITEHKMHTKWGHLRLLK